MTYEQLIENAWQSGPLSQNHVLFPFEDKLYQKLKGNNAERAIHDQEHRDMLDHWNVPFGLEVEFELSYLEEKRHNRVWHMLLHFKYWKEIGINDDVLKELNEAHPELDLDEVPLPRVIGE